MFKSKDEASTSERLSWLSCHSNSDNFKKLSVLAEILVSYEENACKFLVSYKKYMNYVQCKLWFIPAIFAKSIEFLILRYN